jgi:hypothetical protein
MRLLPFDYAHCLVGEQCDRAKSCLRSISWEVRSSSAEQHYLWVFNPENPSECDSYIPEDGNGKSN